MCLFRMCFNHIQRNKTFSLKISNHKHKSKDKEIISKKKTHLFPLFFSFPSFSFCVFLHNTERAHLNEGVVLFHKVNPKLFPYFELFPKQLGTRHPLEVLHTQSTYSFLDPTHHGTSYQESFVTISFPPPLILTESL